METVNRFAAIFVIRDQSAPYGTARTWDPGTYPSYWELVAE